MKRGVEAHAKFSMQDISLLGAALWAMHPIHTQAVTYVIQRMASMAGMFYMVALWCYLKARLHYGLKGQMFFFFLAMVFWLAGLGTKENAVLLPLAIVAYEVAFFNIQAKKIKKYGFALLCLIVFVSLIVLIIRDQEIINLLNKPYEKRPFTMWQRIITEPIVLVRYLALLLYPVADFLTLESDIMASASLFDPPVTVFANLAVLLLVILCTAFLRKYSLICFALLFFFINHLVESTFLGLELYFEHRNYLPSIFIYLAASFYFLKLCDFYLIRKKHYMNVVLIVSMTFILISEGNSAYLRNEVWKNEISSLSDAIKKAPLNIRPYISIGAEYIKIGDFDKSLKYLREAESLFKKYPDRYQDNWLDKLYYNAGVAYLKKEDFQKSLLLHKKSLEFNDENWQCHVNLGYLFFMLGDIKNAQRAMVNAIMINENEPDAYNMYGRFLYADEQLDLAVDVFLKGMSVGETPELSINLVAAYIKKGDSLSAKKEIIRFPFEKQDNAYLLYRALFFPGEERQQLLDKVAYNLFASKVDYCAWLKTVKENNFPGIIYPDVTEIEDQLTGSYIAIMTKTVDQLRSTVNTVNECN